MQRGLEDAVLRPADLDETSFPTRRIALPLFRYRTRCGTVYGHTGSFPGYVQFAAASADGRRAVTTSLNIPVPTGPLLAQLREVQADAVCAVLKG